MKWLFFVIMLVVTNPGYTRQDALPVSYSLEGVREMASVFRLNPDSSFEFFYAYGALDRYGKGTWKREKDEVVLTSHPYPGRDFKIIDSSNGPGAMVLRLKEQNPVFYNYFYCRVKTSNGDTLLKANREGLIRLNRRVDTIQLLFELTPEKVSSFPVPNSKVNHFTFAFEPWISEIFFNGFRLRYKNDHLEGRHPLLDNKVYRYERVQ